MANDNPYIQYHLNLLTALKGVILEQPPFNLSERSEPDSEFIESLTTLCQTGESSEAFNHDGQQLICKIISSYPHITPLIHRDLLWFFGGDCLHFMPDDEIAKYQQLEERRFEAEDQQQAFDFESEKAKVFKD